ncbi:MAG: glycosyltransferase family 1 protein, partial [Actinomycetota bacterium]|nr:glycosyltransferase family 1 protein [Actinomycetota bacterium]
PAVRVTEPGQWWPPPALSASWIADHHDEFDLMHLQFGFDALGPTELERVVDELDRRGKPLIYTVHDLRNPHHLSDRAHNEALDVLLRRAASLITLTEGAATVINHRWGRHATVLPHPHVVPIGHIRPRPRNTGRFVIGVHAKSVRASMDPLPVIYALVQVVRELGDAELRVNVHHDVFDDDGERHDRDLARYLSVASRSGDITLSVHDCFSDDELWDYLEALDLSVLPYRFGTHSGWLEACHDLGTTVLAPDCGFYREQRECLSYTMNESEFDENSVRTAVQRAYTIRPVWQATAAGRVVEREAIATAHREIYRKALSA